MTTTPIEVSDVAMTVSGALTHRCPFVDEVDHGHVTITWRCAGGTLELRELAAYLRRHRDAIVTHEELTDRIRRDLSTLPGIELLAVETQWETAGLEVQCSTLRTPVAPW